MELERHIEILLLDNDCVIVPDLGGFMAHHVDARYDASEGLFLPPLRTLGFNPQLRLNDHLLVQSYIEAYDISYPEALRCIEEEVRELKQHIESEGMYELNDIGVLRLNEEGNYEFEPCEAGILTPSFYGLSSFEMNMLDAVAATSPRTDSLLLARDNEAGSRNGEPELYSSPVEEEKNDSEDNAESADTIVVSMSLVRNIAAIAAAVLLFFVIGSPIENSIETNVQQSSVLPVGMNMKTSQDLKEAGETGMQAMDESKAPEVRATEVKEESVAAELKQAEVASSMPATPESSFVLVLASQTPKKHAEEFIGRLKKDGLTDTRMMPMSNTEKVRVVYGAYASEEEAHGQLRALRQSNSVFAEAWVLKVR